ncbi:MAG: hypothetical protein QOJ95_5627 [Mycobacterium sp.]|nr:hypothetical protein [Mycobacterium sp.]
MRHRARGIECGRIQIAERDAEEQLQLRRHAEHLADRVGVETERRLGHSAQCAVSDSRKFCAYMPRSAATRTPAGEALREGV